LLRDLPPFARQCIAAFLPRPGMKGEARSENLGEATCVGGWLHDFQALNLALTRHILNP
jgi:hypothetical protein